MDSAMFFSCDQSCLHFNGQNLKKQHRSGVCPHDSISAFCRCCNSLGFIRPMSSTDSLQPSMMWLGLGVSTSKLEAMVNEKLECTLWFGSEFLPQAKAFTCLVVFLSLVSQCRMEH